jgi:beta-galactosidase
VLGPRTGYGDPEGRARPQRAPARLAVAAGAWYDEVASLAAPVPVDGDLPGSASGFAEGLVVETATAVATYRHPHLGRWAAITTNAVGAGRVTVVGTVPDQELAAAFTRWMVPEPIAGWHTDAPVTVSTSTSDSGNRLHVVHNWGWAPAVARPASPVKDLLSGATSAAGEAVDLGPWDVRVFVTFGN